MKNLINTILKMAIIALVINPLYAEENKAHVKDELYLTSVHIPEDSCFGPILQSTREVQKDSRFRLWDLVQKKKLDKSWLNAPIVSTDKGEFGSQIEWIIHYQNKNVKDVNKQNVYIFLDEWGLVMGSNYIGK